MTLWKGCIFRLWQWAALALQRALGWVTEGLSNQVGEPYLLRPRCCHNEQFRDLT
jgi:hypothetical protein